MTDLIFYTNPMSRGRIARWMLEEAGAAYDTEVISFGEPMHGADYKAINPMAKVPAIRHGGVIVTEVAAICAYLADAFPDAGLAPDPRSPDRGPYYRWLFFGAGPVEQAVVNESFGWKTGDPGERGRTGYGSLGRVCRTLDAHLSDGPICWATGSARSMSISARRSPGASGSRPCPKCRPSHPTQNGLRIAPPPSAPAKRTTR